LDLLLGPAPRWGRHEKKKPIANSTKGHFAWGRKNKRFPAKLGKNHAGIPRVISEWHHIGGNFKEPQAKHDELAIVEEGNAQEHIHEKKCIIRVQRKSL